MTTPEENPLNNNQDLQPQAKDEQAAVPSADAPLAEQQFVSPTGIPAVEAGIEPVIEAGGPVESSVADDPAAAGLLEDAPAEATEAGTFEVVPAWSASGQTDSSSQKKPALWLIALAVLLVIALLGTAVFAAISFFGNGNSPFGSANRANAAAIVNGEVISIDDLDLEMSRIEIANPGIFDTGMDLGQWREMLLDEMIDRMLLEQAARDANISVDTGELDSQLEALKANFEDDSQYLETLAEFNMTEEELRDQLYSGLLVEGLLEQTADGGAITNEQYMALIDQLHSNATIEILDPVVVEWQTSIDAAAGDGLILDEGLDMSDDPLYDDLEGEGIIIEEVDPETGDVLELD